MRSDQAVMMNAPRATLIPASQHPSDVSIQAKVVGKIYRWLMNTKKRILYVRGSSGSAKSYTVAQWIIIEKLLRGEDQRWAVVRKTMPSLKISAMQLIVDHLRQWDLYQYCEHNKTDGWIRLGSNVLHFFALDDVMKKKGFEANGIWIEEATDIDRQDQLMLELRLRRRNLHGMNQMVLTFNKVSTHSYLYKITETEFDPESSAVLDVSYLDNPYLPKEMADAIERLKKIDPTLYEIYALNKWGELKNLIYTNWNRIKLTEYPEKCDDYFFGVDFGFNAPCVLVQEGMKDLELYERELIYQSGLTNQEFIRLCKDRIPTPLQKRPIYCDSAEPDRIKEMRLAGLNAIPCVKRDKSDGIIFVKQFPLHITEDSVNGLKEIECYKWEEKDNEPTDHPAEVFNHLQDARLYAVTTHLGGKKNEPRVRYL